MSFGLGGQRRKPLPFATIRLPAAPLFEYPMPAKFLRLTPGKPFPLDTGPSLGFETKLFLPLPFDLPGVLASLDFLMDFRVRNETTGYRQ